MRNETYHQEWTDLLSAYLDGELDPPTRRRLEAHLASCQACSDVRDALRRVVAVAPAYVGEAPTKDLWPAIAAEIDARRMVTLPSLAPARPRVAPWLVAAAVLVAAGAGTARWLARAPSPAPVAVTPAPPAAPSVLNAAVGFESPAYDAAVAELSKVLAERRGSLDTSTVRVLEESLAAIDRAIAEARAAIQRDTANGYLNEQIASNLRKKINVLRLATRAIAAET